MVRNGFRAHPQMVGCKKDGLHNLMTWVGVSCRRSLFLPEGGGLKRICQLWAGDFLLPYVQSKKKAFVGDPVRRGELCLGTETARGTKLLTTYGLWPWNGGGGYETRLGEFLVEFSDELPPLLRGGGN